MLGPQTPAALDTLHAQLARQSVLVLTGAGISTASGIPDYRDTDGVRRGNAPMMHQEFLGSAQARKRYWARAMLGWHGVSLARPNPAHHALARLQASGHVSGVITQNVDGLHEAAGSTGVIELHGNLHRVVCMDCGKRRSRQQVQAELQALNPYLQDVHAVLAPDGDAQLATHFLQQFQVPHCLGCGSDLLKPDVVFFGDGVAQVTASEAWQAVQQAEALLIVGTSLMAYSSYRLCQEISRQGKPLLAINLGRTRADALLAAKLADPCEYILPRLAEQLGA
ncbi:NAD-dependent protein deacetylase [Pseudomonas typographi]|uniref:NAD-dependent protein deacetylase n=1 Tax=Pseudomonas typographi TaxID=2715964 RepID=A0ABR7Z1M5_9PSED|nr:NAD-dependent protein deacetylase [Pseudomonas typographi]MBD1551711.1 NAD-dependent protein deacetylase [Pseudomonas typographi]MBD1587034.1 NAD-dependent protein deacetylase [Pseudomonas typographi]MBD1599273.1 NAD-dependent protein deacetylase [Pseudomonas typographi]